MQGKMKPYKTLHALVGCDSCGRRIRYGRLWRKEEVLELTDLEGMMEA